jgi:pimeloyl-ACP methyl ester carboxylesterase
VPGVLVVHPSVPAKDMKELAALMKSKPESLTYGTSGVGTSSHLAAEMLNLELGTKVVAAHYQGGSSQRVADLLAGRVNIAFNVAISVVPQIRAGTLRAIAVAQKKRTAILPEVPTLEEAGIRGIEGGVWIGLLAPANTPAPIVAKLSAAANEALKAPDVVRHSSCRASIRWAAAPRSSPSSSTRTSSAGRRCSRRLGRRTRTRQTPGRRSRSHATSPSIKMTGPAHRTVTVASGDVTLFYRRFGLPGRTPIVILHGAFYDSADWIDVAARLASDREIAAFDARGYGRSTWSPSKDYSINANLGDVLAVLDVLRWDKAIVMGASRGGAFGLAFAGQFPERTAGYIAVDFVPDIAIRHPGSPIQLTQTIGNKPRVFASVEDALKARAATRTLHPARPARRQFEEVLRRSRAATSWGSAIPASGTRSRPRPAAGRPISPSRSTCGRNWRRSKCRCCSSRRAPRPRATIRARSIASGANSRRRR